MEPYAIRKYLRHYWRCAAVDDGPAIDRNGGLGRWHRGRGDALLARRGGRAPGRGGLRATGAGPGCGRAVALRLWLTVPGRAVALVTRAAAYAVPAPVGDAQAALAGLPAVQPAAGNHPHLRDQRRAGDAADRQDVRPTGGRDAGFGVFGADVVGRGLAARRLRPGFDRLVADRHLERARADGADVHRLSPTAGFP